MTISNGTIWFFFVFLDVRGDVTSGLTWFFFGFLLLDSSMLSLAITGVCSTLTSVGLSFVNSNDLYDFVSTSVWRDSTASEWLDSERICSLGSTTVLNSAGSLVFCIETSGFAVTFSPSVTFLSWLAVGVGLATGSCSIRDFSDVSLLSLASIASIPEELSFAASGLTTISTGALVSPSLGGTAILQGRHC